MATTKKTGAPEAQKVAGRKSVTEAAAREATTPTAPAPSSPAAPAVDGRYRQIYDDLVAMRKQKLAEISSSSQAVDAEKNYEALSSGDDIDRASALRDREIDNILSSRIKSTLSTIDGAIARIEKGDYGLCHECEEEIPLGRLKVMPFARFCVVCQSGIERHQALTRTVDFDSGASGFSDAGASEDDDEAGDD